MNIKVEKKENSVVEIEFTMGKEQFNAELDKAYKQNAKKFKVPGFRAGMVPRAVVEQTYGEGVLYEFVIENTVDEAYRTAVEENNLEIVSRPELDIKQIGKDKDFVFVVNVCVKPEATVKDYKGIEVKKVSTRVTKKDVDAEIEKIREKNARIVTVEDRELKEGDISVIDFEGFVDGVAFEGGKGENFELTIGSGQFIPGFEDQMVGMKKDETRDVNVKFPEQYHSAELAGKDATFKVVLHEIKEKVLPEVDDEFAKDVSEFDTLEDYKKDLNKKVKAEKEARAKAEMEQEAIEKFIEKVEVTIPEGMIDSEVDKMVEEMNANLSYQGLNIDQYLQYIGISLEDYKKEMRGQAEKRIKLSLGLEFIAKEEKVEVTDDEIDARIKELAAQYGNKDDNSLLKNENARNYMRQQLSQDKVMKVITDNVVEK
ncbi:MAG: trigger factor [Clostridia bacterium]|nr:trigger factor [Clostridia bacterium]